MEPVWGEKYRLWIPGEPVPKSTMKPPVVRRYTSERQRLYLERKLIDSNPDYLPLKKTHSYQKWVADSVNLDVKFPQFDERDPIKLDFAFYKGKHATGDLKNLIAAVEDGIQLSGKIPNDRQINGYGEPIIHYFADVPGTVVVAELLPLAAEHKWLSGWLNTSQKKTLEYAEMRGIELKR